MGKKVTVIPVGALIEALGSVQSSCDAYKDFDELLTEKARNDYRRDFATKEVIESILKKNREKIKNYKEDIIISQKEKKLIRRLMGYIWEQENRPSPIRQIAIASKK